MDELRTHHITHLDRHGNVRERMVHTTNVFHNCRRTKQEFADAHEFADVIADAHDLHCGKRKPKPMKKQHRSSGKSKKMMTAMTMACMLTSGSSQEPDNNQPDETNPNQIKSKCCHFDRDDEFVESPGRVLHLSIDCQTTRKNVRNNPEQFKSLQPSTVNEFLDDMDWNQLIGQHETFDTVTCAMNQAETIQQHHDEALEQLKRNPSLACAINAMEQTHKLETLQPRLAWKPLQVIAKTLENTTQWGRMTFHCPMKDHIQSRFPWSNRRRLREVVGMDTIFMTTKGHDGSNCEQVFNGFMSRMINVCPMESKSGENVLKACQDFMRHEGVPQGLHRDLAQEEKTAKIIDLNRRMMVKDTWSESHHPNQNPVEAQGVNPLKKGATQLMNRTGANDRAWPWAHKCIADINNICATPVLNWRTPKEKRHGHTPDISACLQFQFNEKVHFKIEEGHPGSKEAPGHWWGVSENVGDNMTFTIWSNGTKKEVHRSVVRSADPNRGGIPNLRRPHEEPEQEEAEIVDPENILDDPALFCPPPEKLPSNRTNKHKTKVKFHDAAEDHFHDAEEPPNPSDFGPKVTPDELPQSHPERRKRMKRTGSRRIL